MIVRDFLDVRFFFFLPIAKLLVTDRPVILSFDLLSEFLVQVQIFIFVVLRFVSKHLIERSLVNIADVVIDVLIDIVINIFVEDQIDNVAFDVVTHVDSQRQHTEIESTGKESSVN